MCIKSCNVHVDTKISFNIVLHNALCTVVSYYFDNLIGCTCKV